MHDPRTGRQPEKNFYGTYAKACAELERWRAEIAGAGQPPVPDGKAMKVGAWAVMWLDQYYRWKVRPVDGNAGIPRRKGTWENAKAMTSAYIIPRLGDRPIGRLTFEDCYTAIGGLRVHNGTQEASAATKGTAASVLRLMLADAHSMGIIASDPAKKLPTNWGYGKRKLIVPSIIQAEVLAEEMDHTWPGRGDLIRVFAYTGLRWEELAGLRWEHVHWNRASMFITEVRPARASATEQATKTEASERYASILEQAIDPLRRLEKFALDREAEHVMVGERGQPLSYGLWRKHLKSVRDATGIDYTAHSLRHLAVSIMIAGGASSMEVRDQVGHSTSWVTERVYRHAFSMNRTELSKRLSQAVTKVEVDERGEAEDC